MTWLLPRILATLLAMVVGGAAGLMFQRPDAPVLGAMLGGALVLGVDRKSVV